MPQARDEWDVLLGALGRSDIDLSNKSDVDRFVRNLRFLEDLANEADVKEERRRRMNTRIAAGATAGIAAITGGIVTGLLPRMGDFFNRVAKWLSG